MKRLALVVIILLVLVVAAYCVYRPVPPVPTPTAIAVGPTPTPTLAGPTPTPTRAGPSPIPNPVADLLDIFKGWGKVKSFRAKMTSTGAPTFAQAMTLEAVMPDRFHVTMAQNLDVIIIGKDVYSKVGDRWQKTVAPQGLDLTFADPKRYESQLSGTSQVKDVSIEMLDGVQTRVYQYTTTVQVPRITRTVTSKIWVSVADNLPRKVESNMDDGSKTTIIYSDYDADITIKPPM